MFFHQLITYFYRCIVPSVRDSGIKSSNDGVASTVAYRVDMSVLFAICNHCCSFVIRLSRHFLTRKKISCITPLWILLFKILIPIYKPQNYYGILCCNSATKVVTDVARLFWLQTNMYMMTGLHKLASLLKKWTLQEALKHIQHASLR